MSDLTARAEERVREVAAAFAVQRAYRSYRQRGVFAQMKMALLSAEAATTDGVLRRVNRAEGYLARDPACAMVRARFRFAADDGEFPPRIVYKLYNSGMPVQYLSGDTCFAANSRAELEAAKCMGQRQNLRVQRHYLARVRSRAPDGPGAVRTRRALLRQVSELDRRPVYLGGRGNSWRELDGTDLTSAARFLGAGSVDAVPVKGLKRSGHVHNWHSHLRWVTTRNPAPETTGATAAAAAAAATATATATAMAETEPRQAVGSATRTRRPTAGGGSGVGLGASASFDGRRRNLSQGWFAVPAYTERMPRAGGAAVSASSARATKSKSKSKSRRAPNNGPRHMQPLTDERGTIVFRGGVDYNQRPKAWDHAKPRAGKWKSSARVAHARDGTTTTTSSSTARRNQRRAVATERPTTCPARARVAGPSSSSSSSSLARLELEEQEGYHWKPDAGHFETGFARSWPRW